MRRSESLWYVGGFGVSALMGAVLIVSAAEASLPTGGMLLPRPRGPARSDMPASTSIVVYRIPSGVAYGLPWNESGSPAELTDDDSVYAVKLPENGDARPIESYRPDRRGYGGLHGICVVTLRDQRRLATPQSQFYSVYLSQRYEFASSEAKDAFDANPALYAPAFEGRDAVMVAWASDDGLGTLRYAGFYRQRLYLFQSADSRDEFCRDPRRYAVE